jgi:hypothetical protein
MTGKYEVVLNIFIEKHNKAAEKVKSHYLFLLNYESCEVLTRKHLICSVVQKYM